MKRDPEFGILPTYESLNPWSYLEGQRPTVLAGIAGRAIELCESVDDLSGGKGS